MFGPKAKERRRISRAAKATRPAAYADARALCAAVGPEAIAEEYDADQGASLKQIATVYAGAAYRKETRRAARDGALAGFEDFAGAHRAVARLAEVWPP